MMHHFRIFRVIISGVRTQTAIPLNKPLPDVPALRDSRRRPVRIMGDLRISVQLPLIVCDARLLQLVAPLATVTKVTVTRTGHSSITSRVCLAHFRSTVSTAFTVCRLAPHSLPVLTSISTTLLFHVAPRLLGVFQ